MAFTVYLLTASSLALLQAFSGHIYQYLGHDYTGGNPIIVNRATLQQNINGQSTSYDLHYKDQKKRIIEPLQAHGGIKNYSATVVKDFGPAALENIHNWMTTKCGMLIDDHLICYTKAFIDHPQDKDYLCPHIGGQTDRNTDMGTLLLWHLLKPGFSHGWWFSQFDDHRRPRDSRNRRLQKDMVYISNLLCMKYYLQSVPRPIERVDHLRKTASANGYPDPIATLKDIISGNSPATNSLYNVVFTNSTLPPNRDAQARCFPTIYSTRNAFMCIPSATFDHLKAAAPLEHQSTDSRKLLGHIEYQTLILHDWLFSNLTFRTPRFYSPDKSDKLFTIFPDYANPVPSGTFDLNDPMWVLFRRMNYGDLLDENFKIPLYGPGVTFITASNSRADVKLCYCLDYGNTFLCTTSSRRTQGSLRKPSYYQYLEFILHQLTLPVGDPLRILTTYQGACFDITPDRNDTKTCDDSRRTFRLHYSINGDLRAQTTTVLSALDRMNPLACPEMLYAMSMVSGCYLGRDSRYNGIFLMHPPDLALSPHSIAPAMHYEFGVSYLKPFKKPTDFYDHYDFDSTRDSPRDPHKHIYSDPPPHVPASITYDPLSHAAQNGLSPLNPIIPAHTYATVDNRTKEQMTNLWTRLGHYLNDRLGRDRNLYPHRKNYSKPFRFHVYLQNPQEVVNEYMHLTMQRRATLVHTVMGKALQSFLLKQTAPTDGFTSSRYPGPKLLPKSWTAHPGKHISGGIHYPDSSTDKMDGELCVLAIHDNVTCIGGDYNSFYGSCYCHTSQTICGTLQASPHVYNFQRPHNCPEQSPKKP